MICLKVMRNKKTVLRMFKVSDVKNERNVDKKGLGVVVLIDALGIKNIKLEEAETFLKNWKDILEETQSIGGRLFELRTIGLGKAKTVRVSFPSFPATFGDTILLTWDEIDVSRLKTPERTYLKSIFSWIWNTLSNTMRIAFQKKIYLRGAISIGKYIRKRDTALGPAITDVVEWYERTDWCGIIATPSCGYYLDYLASKSHPSLCGFWKYCVPLKKAQRQDLWCVGWPWKYIAEAIKKQGQKADKNDLINYLRMLYRNEDERKVSKKARSLFLQDLIGSLIPKGTEKKYKHTFQFFKWCVKKELSTLPQYIQTYRKKRNAKKK